MASTLETISALYKNILGREGEGSETAYWVERIEGGVESVADVVSAFTASAEAQANVAPIVDLYFSAFGRAPDVEGLNYWVAAKSNGTSLSDIAKAFTQSSEFSQHATSTDTAFVTALYQNALGRAPDAQGLAYWNAQLASGMTRDQLLSSITASPESHSTTGIKTQVVLTWNGLLGRMPTSNEIDTVLQTHGDKSVLELVKDTATELLLNPPVITPVPTTPVPTTPTEATFTPMVGTTGGSSDASTAIALDAKYMIVGDDESSILRVYDRSGGDAVLEWDYAAVTGSTDEVDLEAATLVNGILYLTGSHSNKKTGKDADSRELIFAVKISGTGAETTFKYLGKFTGMEAALVAWDQTENGGRLGLAASSGAGVAPENTNGFSIEGLTTSTDDSALWLSFRAPQIDSVTRDKALIVPVINYAALLDGSDTTTPVFGDAIELNLGGRGIRSIDKAADGSGYLILAGPAGTSSAEVTHDFRLFTWTGDANSAPVELNNNLDALLKATGGSFESIVSPASIKPGTQIQLLQDNGDTIWSGQTKVSKDLDYADQQFKGNLITLGSEVVDTTAPALVSATPAKDSTDAAVKSTLTLTFDEGVALGNGLIELRSVKDNALVETSVKVDFNKIILTPAADLLAATQYQIVLNPNAVTDHSSNAIAAGQSLTFTTQDAASGVKPHYDLLITEVNSNAKGGDFFELYNYGSEDIDLSGWKMDDSNATFSDGAALPSNLTLAAGQSLVITTDSTVEAFKTAWGLGSEANVFSIAGPGLGGGDAVVLFDADGNVATFFSFISDSITASDGTSITTAAGFKATGHAGLAYGGSDKAVSAVWDGLSSATPNYTGAVAGELGAVAQAGNATSVGSPLIVQVGVPILQDYLS